jgi:hypothetical protein
VHVVVVTITVQANGSGKSRYAVTNVNVITEKVRSS